MPLYRFHCRKCGKDFEVFLRLSELSQGGVCPECHGREVDNLQYTADEGQASTGEACGIKKAS